MSDDASSHDYAARCHGTISFKRDRQVAMIFFFWAHARDVDEKQSDQSLIHFRDHTNDESLLNEMISGSF